MCDILSFRCGAYNFHLAIKINDNKRYAKLAASAYSAIYKLKYLCGRKCTNAVKCENAKWGIWHDMEIRDGGKYVCMFAAVKGRITLRLPLAIN